MEPLYFSRQRHIQDEDCFSLLIRLGIIFFEQQHLIHMVNCVLHDALHLGIEIREYPCLPRQAGQGLPACMSSIGPLRKTRATIALASPAIFDGGLTGFIGVNWRTSSEGPMSDVLKVKPQPRPGPGKQNRKRKQPATVKGSQS